MNSFFDILFHVLVILSLLLYFYYTKIYNVRKLFVNIPKPPAKWILGHLHEFTSSSAFIKSLHEHHKKYGKIFHLQMGPFKDMLISTDPDFINFALNDNKAFGKGASTNLLRPWLGEGLVLSEGDRWRFHRKLINPAFNYKMLEKFVPIFETCSDVLIDRLSQVSGSQSFDCCPYMSSCAFDMICETSMGTKVYAQNSENLKYSHDVNELARIAASRFLSIYKRYNIGFYFSKDYLIHKKCLQSVHEYVDRVISEKIKDAKNENNKNNEDIEDKRKIFMDLLIGANFEYQDFTQTNIKDNVNAFMFAGHHTTASASSFILYCLADHKDIQDKIFKEQQQIFSDVKNPKVTFAVLQQMNFLECVIKESMRLYPPVVMLGRKCLQETNYKGLVLPKGVQLGLFVRGLHMSPEYYSNPEKFDPSRFEVANEKQHLTYLPFGTGPRNCIGQKYAMLEMKSLISKIVRNFELTPAIPQHSIKLAFEIVLKSSNGVRIGIKRRSNSM